MIRLIAPRDKVLPYLDRMRAHGEWLLSLPLETPEDIRAAFEAHHAWYLKLFEVLQRGFTRSDQDELNLNMVISRNAWAGGFGDEDREAYRRQVQGMIDVLDQAREACGS
jgi:hypothetical protein